MIDYIKPQMVRIIHDKPDKTMTLHMVHLPKGSFMMDSKDPNEGLIIQYDFATIETDSDGNRFIPNVANKVKVVIDQEFELGKYPVTISQYMYFANETKEHYPDWLNKGNKYHIDTGTNNDYKKMDLSDNAPIIGVSWHDAKAYCKWLSKKTGDNYRLPTEAEWEYACRAGTTTKWSFGDDEEELNQYAWYDKNSNSKTHPVGIEGERKLPNLWGLYDMHGNVWEWCEDWFVDNYENAPRDGSTNKGGDQKYKVLRGGSWDSDAIITSSANCGRGNPEGRNYIWGFRLLRTLPS